MAMCFLEYIFCMGGEAFSIRDRGSDLEVDGVGWGLVGVVIDLG